jgi:thiamine pyrophosphokinase
MSKFIVFLPAIFCLFSANANGQLFDALYNTGNEAYPEPLTKQVFNNWRATGNKSRLMYRADGLFKNGTYPAFSDSMTFIYHSDRGWDAALGEWAYDERKGVNGHEIKVYGTDGRLVSHDYAFGPSTPQRRLFTYTGSGKIATYTHDSKGSGRTFIVTDTYSYDSLGRRTKSIGKDDSLIYNYDSNGLVSTERYMRIGGTVRLYYGNYASYVGGRLSEWVYNENVDKGNNVYQLTERQRNIYEYDKNGNVVRYYNIVPNVGFGRIDSSKSHYTYDADGYITTIITQAVRNGKDSTIATVDLAYNYLHQIVSEKRHDWQYNREYRYHYQPVFPASVNSIPGSAQADMLLYPVPAKGSINVSLTGIAGNIRLTIVRMDGSRVREWGYRLPEGKSNVTLDLNNIPPGNYLLRIDGNNAGITKPFVLQ